MERYFQKLFGVPTTIALDVVLLRPQEGELGPEDFEYPAWGRFALWVDGKNLTASVGPQGEYAPQIEWDLQSILEWFVGNWEAIFYEEVPPGKDLGPTGVAGLEELASRARSGGLPDRTEMEFHKARYTWRDRHSMQAGRDGGLIPNVVLRRYLDDFEVSWDSQRPIEGSERRFVEQAGSFLVDLGEANRVLHDFLVETIDQILTEHPNEEAISALRTRMDQLFSGTNKEARILRLAGLHSDRAFAETGRPVSVFPSELDLLKEDEPVAEEGVILHSTVTLLFRSLSPNITEKDVDEVKRVLHQSAEGTPPSEDLRKMIKKVKVEFWRPAWQQGLELAKDFRTSFGLDSGEPLESEAVLRGLGIKRADLRLSDHGLRALSFRSTKYLPCIALNSNSSFFQAAHAREFDLAHELCHLLYDQEFGRPIGVVSGPWAPQFLEQRANAFAAHLRLPNEAIKLAFGAEPPAEVGPDDVKKLMAAYTVGATVATWQLKHFGWITEFERLGLLDLLGVAR